MKCTCATILGLLISACCLAHENNSSQAGLELGSLIMQTHIKAFISHRILSNWSVKGKVSIAIHDFSDKNNEEEKHKAEFSDDTVKRVPASSHTCIGITYWPQRTYNGFFISTGGKTTLSGKADCTVELGYCMKICRWLTLSTQYGTDLIASYRSDKFKGDGLEIYISITF